MRLVLLQGLLGFFKMQSLPLWDSKGRRKCVLMCVSLESERCLFVGNGSWKNLRSIIRRTTLFERGRAVNPEVFGC